MNDLPKIHQYLLNIPQISEETPFGNEYPVYKLCGKIIAILIPDEIPPRINLKCQPEYAVELRAQHEQIKPGFHMNKKHWNTIYLNGELSNKFILNLIDHSLKQIIEKMSKKIQKQLSENKFFAEILQK